jgi:hypothetical protein
VFGPARKRTYFRFSATIFIQSVLGMKVVALEGAKREKY